jgi:hypothetical protein
MVPEGLRGLDCFHPVAASSPDLAGWDLKHRYPAAEAEAHEALQNYLASVPTGPKTIAAGKALAQFFTNPHSDPRYLEMVDRQFEGLRKVGVPEQWALLTRSKTLP